MHYDSQKPISASLSNDITLLSSLLATQKALTSSIRLEPKRKVNWQSAISVLLNINEPHIIHGVAGSIGLTSMKCVVYSGYASPSLVDKRSDPKGMDQSFTQCAVKLDATRGAMLLENWSRDPRDDTPESHVQEVFDVLDHIRSDSHPVDLSNLVLFIHNCASKRMNQTMEELEEYWGQVSPFAVLEKCISAVSKHSASWECFIEVKLEQHQLALVKKFIVHADHIIFMPDGKLGFWIGTSNLGNWVQLFQFMWKQLKDSLVILSKGNFPDEAGLTRDSHLRIITLLVSCFHRLNPLYVHLFSLPFDELSQAFSEAERGSRVRVGMGFTVNLRVRLFDDIFLPGCEEDPAHIRAIQSVAKLTSWYQAAVWLGNNAPTYLSQKPIDVSWISRHGIAPFRCSKEEAAAILMEVTGSQPDAEAVDNLCQLSSSATVHVEAALAECVLHDHGLDILPLESIGTRCCQLCWSLQKDTLRVPPNEHSAIHVPTAVFSTPWVPPPEIPTHKLCLLRNELLAIVRECSIRARPMRDSA